MTVPKGYKRRCGPGAGTALGGAALKIQICIGSDYMAGAKTQQPIKTKRRIGSTTYIVTSHFQKEGSTANDKIRCLIDMNTKLKGSTKRADF